MDDLHVINIRLIFVLTKRYYPHNNFKKTILTNKPYSQIILYTQHTNSCAIVNDMPQESPDIQLANRIHHLTHNIAGTKKSTCRRVTFQYPNRYKVDF